MHLSRPARIVAACLSLGLASKPGLAENTWQTAEMPLPFAPAERPAQPPFDGLATGAVILRPDNAASPPADIAGDMTALKKAMDALASGNLPLLRSILRETSTSKLDKHILQWAMARSGSPAVSSSEIADAARELSGWPGATLLLANSERALYREKPAAEDVLQAFKDMPPQRLEGAVALARAHVALGNVPAAAAVLSPFWRKAKLDAAGEIAILKEFGGIIAQADHRFRLEQMLYDDRIKSAERLAARVGAEALVKAWAAVIRGNKDAGTLLEAVPKGQRSAGYLMAKAQYLRRAGKYSEAAAIVLGAPRDAKSLVDPDAWWIERRVLSRELLDMGDAKTAYAVAANHAAESPSLFADAEFHAGWYALQGLRDPKTAARHFGQIARIAEGPISLSRAYYWLGRSAEEGGPGEASAYYAQAARYGASFYGQLAAAKLGRSSIELQIPQPTGTERKRFAGREVVHAIQRLEMAGYSRQANDLYRDLAAELESPGEIALLAAMAEKRGDHYTALRIGKIAASRGVDVGALAHPVGAIPGNAEIDGAGKALAYAIARQESEFNVSAVSPVGARGLLQLLPGTARDMATRNGLAYSVTRLTSDAGYNATLGAAYLSDQLARFDGSYILTFVGYNAGPRRAQQWLARYGDPRGKDIDAVVDWVERIPFTETRNYVQRVMENYQVYKLRLTGRFDIVTDLTNGRL